MSTPDANFDVNEHYVRIKGTTDNFFSVLREARCYKSEGKTNLVSYLWILYSKVYHNIEYSIGIILSFSNIFFFMLY